MAGLHGQYGTSSSQVRRRHDIRCCSQVGADPNSFQDGGGCHKGLHIGDTERVGALGDRLRASFGQSGGQKGNVSGLVGGDLLQVAVEGVVKASSSEVRLGEVGETFTIKLVLKVL